MLGIWCENAPSACTLEECSTSSSGVWTRVRLAVSEVTDSKGLVPMRHREYHTSVLLNGREYSFGSEGLRELPVVHCRPPSHRCGSGTRIFCVGQTRHTGREIMQILGPHFDPDAYDVVAKNCNTFTDVALAFLLSRRLPQTFAMERAARAPFLGGTYRANPKAEHFDVEALVLKVDPNAWMGTSEELELEQHMAGGELAL